MALGLAIHAEPAPGPAPLQPLPDEPPPVDLAPYMGELQMLTHKLSLSVGAGNRELAKFYAYESVQLLGEIQREVPEYRRQPIAVLIDRMALPAMARLNAALDAEDADDDRAAALGAVENVVASCNECHHATLHGFIEITVETKLNPFNQDFSPGP